MRVRSAWDGGWIRFLAALAAGIALLAVPLLHRHVLACSPAGQAQRVCPPCEALCSADLVQPAVVRRPVPLIAWFVENPQDDPDSASIHLPHGSRAPPVTAQS